jgi:hypothetical protein
MPKYIIERSIPQAGQLSAQELQAISQQSCNVLNDMGKPYHWVQTFVTDNKLYCVHIAPDEETVREHARRGGFPVDQVAIIQIIIDPTTAEG